MIIKIRPLDNLFFRTGKPFTMGEDTWTESLFPPYPSTLYGAIRSFLIFQREGLKAFINGKYKDDIGIPKEKGSFKIKGPLISKNNGLFFPAPLDLVKLEEKKLIPLVFTKKPQFFISDYSLPYILINKLREQVKESEGWLADIELKDYLKNKKPEYSFIENNNLFLSEPKIGIAREKTTLATKEGYLYRIPMIRVKNNVSLVAEIEGVSNMAKTGIIQLGGESKGAKFEAIENIFERLKNIDLNLGNKFFKIYLATPAIFKKGWIPEWLSEENFEGKYPKPDGIKLKLILCAIGKPVHIGGWDIENKKPKPLYKAIPPGSVYYFKVLENLDSLKIKEAFHLKNISDVNSEEGFGLSIAGEVKG